MFACLQIIPPTAWKPRKGDYSDVDKLKIESPIEQIIRGRQGLYQWFNIAKKSMNVGEYRKLAESMKYKTPK